MFIEENYFITHKYENGYVPLNIPNHLQNFERTYKLQTEVKAQSLNHFIELITILKEYNTNIVFVMTPEFGINANEYKMNKNLQIIELLSKKYNIPFLNYNTKLRSYLNNHTKYYNDWGHMNFQGSTIFSKILSNDLKPIFTLYSRI